MRRWAFLISMAAIALGISFLIIPSKEELALLHVHDKDFTIAEEIYEEEVQEEKDIEQRTVIPLVKLYLKNGETEKAIEVLKKLIEDDPENTVAHEYLAKVYKDTQNRYEYMKALGQLNNLQPDPKLSRELAKYNEFIQNESQEIKHLQELVKQEKASKEEILSLAKLYISQKKTNLAVALLIKTLPKLGEQDKYENLYFLLSLLIADKQIQKLQDVAEDYISPKHVKASVEVLQYLSTHGAKELAYKLTLPLIEAVPFNPHLIEWQVTYHMRNKDRHKATILLLKLAEKKQLPTKLESELIGLAILHEDPKILSKSLRVVQLRAFPYKELLNLTEYLINKKRTQEAHYVRLKLGKNFLKKTPLLETLLEAVDKNVSPTNAAEKLKNIKNLTPKDRLRLAQVFHISKSDDLAKTILTQHFSFQDVSEKDIVDVVETLISLNMEQKSLLMLMKKYKDIKKAPKAYQRAWALLATASGMEEKVSDWYEVQEALNPKFLLKLQELAAKKKLLKLSEDLATQLYKIEKTENSKMRLVDAYMENKSFAKAEPILKEFAYSKEGAWEHDYVIVLKKLNKTKELSEYWATKANSDGEDTKKKRDIGYILLKAGDKSKAKKIFLELARGKGPKHPDVEQLLSIWGGVHLQPEGLRWIEKRTRNAPLREKRTWLKKILYSGEPTRVIRLVEEMNIGDQQGITSIYMEALESIRDRRGLQKVLSREIDKKSDIKVLIKLAELASFSRSRTLERKALKKMSQIDPEHPFVLRMKASRAIAKKQYTKAMKLLDKLFAKGQEDVRSLYNYAEILRHQKNIEKAKSYYQKVIHELKTHKSKNLEFHVIEAKALYFIGKKPESIRKHKKLLAENKNNKNLKADIAHFFMDVGELKEAEAVLNG